MSGGIFSPDILLEKQGGYMTYHRLENSIIDVIKRSRQNLDTARGDSFVLSAQLPDHFLRQRRMQRR